MQATWLHHRGHQSLILFYGGWGVGAADLQHMQSLSDVLMLHDYRCEDFDYGMLAAYRQIDVVAYSMGVAVAARGLAALRPRSATAICGTLDPRAGIGADIYDRTMSTLSPQSFAQFLRRAAAQAPQSVDLAALQIELQRLALRPAAKTARFDRIIGCDKDRIFTKRAMQEAWQDQFISWISGPHMPFPQWQSWQEIVP